MEVCSTEIGKFTQKAYVCFAKDDELYCGSARRGIFAEMALSIVSDGGAVYGASCEEGMEVCHMRASRSAEIEELLGKEYILSGMNHSLEMARLDLADFKYVLFCGTSCQAAFVKNLAGNHEFLYTADLACRNCPSSDTYRINDLTLADYWGHMPAENEYDTDKRHSLAIINTEKGMELLDGIRHKITTQETELADVAIHADVSILSKENENLLKGCIRSYFADLDKTEQDYHVARDFDRLKWFRKSVAEWLNSLRDLNNCRILEIGSGRGASTICMLEKGAYVHGIDIEEKSLEVARYRCKLHNLSNCRFSLSSSTDIDKIDGSFDMIVFFSSLEHMTYEERLTSIRKAFDRDGDALVVLVETPNRLWFEDWHTSYETFYDWLPDRIAVDYARFTKREKITKVHLQKDSVTELIRHGRGVSYHEFEIALGKQNAVSVVSSMSEYFGWQEHHFKEMLKSLGPSYVHHAFFDRQLSMAMRKN